MDQIDRFRGAHQFLSNFYESPIEFEGMEYRTVEHAFQAAKTLDTAERSKIAAAASPTAAKRAGRRVTLRDGWDDQREDIMYLLLRRKFSQPDLAAALLATGEADLIEGNDWGDRYWGVSKGSGQNRLGRLLMRIRDELRATG